MGAKNIHQALLDPATYPQPCGAVEYRETHISRIYLTGTHVLKIKKPLNLGFLDFTTLERRRHFCHEELRLNRRFCPDTYLQVLAIRSENARISLEGPGETIDYGVWMRRLPESRMLDVLIARRDEDLPRLMQQLGSHLATICQEAKIVKSKSTRAAARVVRTNWQENLGQILPFVDQTLSKTAFLHLQRFGASFLKQQEILLHRREDGGMIREGHGDLHAEHICLTDPIRIYDCIEFNRRFRVADVAADLAFLFMDLDWRHRSDLKDILKSSFANSWGEDRDFDRLLPFYQIYRASVRGKVDSILASDSGASQETRNAAAKRARSYFNLALSYLTPPCLILTCGLMGTGKTILAEALAKTLRAGVLRSDIIRKQLAGIGPDEPRRENFGEGIYTPEATRRTYQRLQEMTEAVLATGESVLVDAAFGNHELRSMFRKSASALNRPCVILHLRCSSSLRMERLAQRQQMGHDASDGRPELMTVQEASFIPPGAEEGLVIDVDSARSVDYNKHFVLTRLIELLGEAG